MKVDTNSTKKRSTSRKAVVQAIAKQDIETQKRSFQSPQEIEDAIRMKAYELYLERGGSSSDGMEDWLTAERIILQSVR